jgi:hypothetical protein
MKAYKQPWLNSLRSDWIFILLPPFFSLLLIILFPVQFQQSAKMPIAYWVVLVVFIDVAHVYSTLYRTYFNPQNLRNKYTLLLAIPICCYMAGILIYQLNDLWFWRTLAYLAVFHFIRQQYGFMKLYSRQEENKFNFIDKLAIYSATVYPLIFWHLSNDRNFNWLIEGDFVHFQNNFLLKISTVVYIIVLIAYILKEMLLVIKNRYINIPKNVLIAGTYLSWYFGIVYFNGDMAFTTLNVISHGIPYMALIWFFEKKKIAQSEDSTSKILKLTFGKHGITYFLITLLLLAYFEESLWDGLVWKENQSVFLSFSFLPNNTDQFWLSFIVPLLAIPQVTHYVLDGFIWKKKHKF